LPRKTGPLVNQSSLLGPSRRELAGPPQSQKMGKSLSAHFFRESRRTRPLAPLKRPRRRSRPKLTLPFVHVQPQPSQKDAHKASRVPWGPDKSRGFPSRGACPGARPPPIRPPIIVQRPHDPQAGAGLSHPPRLNPGVLFPRSPGAPRPLLVAIGCLEPAIGGRAGFVMKVPPPGPPAASFPCPPMPSRAVAFS